MVFEQNKTTYDSIIKIKTLQADSLNIKSGGLIHRVDSLQKLKNYIEKKLVTVQNDKRGESEKTLSLVTQLGICESQVKELNENIRVINVGDTVKKLNEQITALISSDSKLSNLRNWYATVLREKNNKIIALENLLKEKNK